jgi:heme/copper-type cytochrome/quinol oxidase subunit 2
MEATDLRDNLTVVTAVVFISLASWVNRSGITSIARCPSGSYTVEVVAQQFQWNFHYPGKDNVFGKTDPKLIDDGSLNFVGPTSQTKRQRRFCYNRTGYSCYQACRTTSTF